MFDINPCVPNLGSTRNITKLPKYEPISLKCVLGVYFFQKEIASVEKVVDIQIPSTLKKLLVDDWEFINEQDKVCISQ